MIGFLRLAAGLLDPSAVYCEQSGYNFMLNRTEEGEVGVCQLPDGSIHDAWDFLQGKSGKEYSYCRLRGYEIKTVVDEEKCSSIFSSECAVCILENRTEVEVTKLMGLTFEEGRCGDRLCVLGENYLNCPQDCSSGSLDMICDGVKDGICDPDCVRLEIPEQDPDCLEIPKEGQRSIYVYFMIVTVVILVITFLIYKIRVAKE